MRLELRGILGLTLSLAVVGCYGHGTVDEGDYPVLSGVDGAWQSDIDPNVAVRRLLVLVGDTYLPYLSANEVALADGADSMTLELPGGSLTQQPFSYQAKCLAALRVAFAGLSADDRARARPLLDDTGCLAFLAAA